jgi:hypothetical protein
MHRSVSAPDGDTAQLPDPGSNPTLAYCTVQPDRWTFGADKIRAWVEQFLDGHVLNACAGQTVLDHEPVHRNDIDPDIDADTHHDVRALPNKLDTQFDVIVYDPPFTVNQASETYDEEAPGYGPDVVHALHSLLRPGGRVVMFGYSTWGMPADRGYRREAVGLFNTLGRQHDYLGVVSRHDPDGEIPGVAHQPATVRANAVAPADHEYEDQPEERVEMSHHECDDSAWLEADTIRTWVEEHLDGKALVVHDRPGVDQLDHSPLRVNSPPDSEWDRTNADMTIAPTALSDRLSQVFETAVFAPATTAFQATTDHWGKQTGLSTAIKREIHEVLEPGGTVIQLGHTASCMRSDFGYERESIAICARPGNHHDIIGTVDRFVHLSALGVDTGIETAYFDAKRRAEEAVRGSTLPWVIYRPSVVFGEGCGFFAFLETWLPPIVAPFPGGGEMRLQPIWVGDLAPMLADGVDDARHAGGTYRIGGPETLTIRTVIELVCPDRTVLPVPMPVAKAGLSIAELLPAVPLGRDQFRVLAHDNTVDDNDVTAFGIEESALRTLPEYLGA